MTVFRLFSLCIFCFSLLGAHGHLRAEASKVTIGLQGHIAPKCGLSGADGKLDFGPIGRAGGRQERAIAFTVDCNTPFTYSMSSANGEMGNGSTTPDPAKTRRFPYQVLLTIPTDDGGTLRKSCDSAHLTGGSSHVARCEVESGEETSMGKIANLTVSWDATSSPLLAGHYSDDLRISVGSKY